MSDEAPPSSPLILVDGHPHLRGSSCGSCATVVFPAAAACARCGSPMEPAALPRRGAVWSWTVQRIRPKPPYRGPEPFEPFAVGYVDLGAVRVESPLSGRAADEWSIGDHVELVDGTADGPAFTFAPAPAGGGPA